MVILAGHSYPSGTVVKIGSPPFGWPDKKAMGEEDVQVYVKDMAEIEAGKQAFARLYQTQKIITTKPALIHGQLVETGTELTVYDPNVVEQGYKDFERSQLRLKIAGSAGDTLSLLGTTSDAVQLLILMECVRASALATANTFDEYKAGCKTGLDALMQSSDSLNELGAKCKGFLTQVEDKKVIFPYTVKYKIDKLGSVFFDVAKRASLTSQILQSTIK